MHACIRAGGWVSGRAGGRAGGVLAGSIRILALHMVGTTCCGPHVPDAPVPLPCPGLTLQNIQDPMMGRLFIPLKDVARNGRLKDVFTLQVWG